MDWKAWLEDRGGHRAGVDAHFAQAIDWIEAQPGSQKTVLELGPGHSHDLRDRLRGQPAIVYHAADLRPESPEVESLAEHWKGFSYRGLPYDGEAFHAVLAREVLEHVDDIYQMVSEIHTALKVGGRLWFSAPFIYPLHDYDVGDYWRLTPKAWEFLFQMHGFDSWSVWTAEGRDLWGSWQYPTEVLGWAQR